ncbi:hypothetical protein DL98DRAFT_519677 [Cadophora sp. DSE1049]|nr:hypothetical protein DL98DRAFT_519677 [Cadophora sp. DSE1049]
MKPFLTIRLCCDDLESSSSDVCPLMDWSSEIPPPPPSRLNQSTHARALSQHPSQQMFSISSSVPRLTEINLRMHTCGSWWSEMERSWRGRSGDVSRTLTMQTLKYMWDSPQS